MNNLWDKFLDDLDKTLEAAKPVKMNTVTIGAGYYEELVAASVKLDVLLELYLKCPEWQFDTLVGAVLSVERPKEEEPAATIPDAKDDLECPIGEDVK